MVILICLRSWMYVEICLRFGVVICMSTVDGGLSMLLFSSFLYVLSWWWMFLV